MIDNTIHHAMTEVEVHCSLPPAEIRYRRMLVFGTPSFVGASLLGYAAGSAIGASVIKNERKKAKWRSLGRIPTWLTEDRIIVAVEGERMDFPYSGIVTWSADRGWLTLRRVGWAPVRIRIPDQAFVDAFARLAHGRTYKTPIPNVLQALRPVVEWSRQDRRFTFGVPRDWVLARPDEMLAPNRLTPQTPVIAGAYWERQPNGRTVMIRDCGHGNDELQPEMIDDLSIHEVAAAMTAFEERVLIGDIVTFALGGARAYMYRIFNPRENAELAHAWVVYGGGIFHIGMGLEPATPGDGVWESTIEDFRTMLATWHWY
jgi:hypothetical protein